LVIAFQEEETMRQFLLALIAALSITAAPVQAEPPKVDDPRLSQIIH
jgi:hypothetical protein